MSETPETVDDVRRDQERHEVYVRLLVERLDQLDPDGAPYDRRWCEWLDRVDGSAYPDDEYGRARFRRDYAAARHADLRSRLGPFTASSERRAALTDARARGISRFVDGGEYGLDRILAPARAHRAERYAASMGVETLRSAEQATAGWEIGRRPRRA